MNIKNKLLLPFILLTIPGYAQAQVINEVFFSPTNRQWIEIYNNTSAEIDLTQYKILDSGAAVNGHAITVVSGSNMLPAGAYAVVAKDTASVSAAHLFKSALGIKTTGDTIVLKKGSVTVDSLVFPEEIEVDNESYQKVDGSWMLSTPSPGFVNSIGADKFTDSGSMYSADSSPSAHYSAIPISYSKSSTILGLGAGRERIAAYGSPLEFRIETNLVYKNRNNFTWNFGDGNIGYGEVVSHVYEYPGNYVVVLNAVFNEGLAIARTNVKVVEPNITVAYADAKRIEIKNNSDEEVNLMGRALVSGDTFFLFPKDTIIGSSQSVSFSSNVTTLRPQNANDVFIAVVGKANSFDIPSRIEEQKLEKISHIQNQIETLLAKLSVASNN